MRSYLPAGLMNALHLARPASLDRDKCTRALAQFKQSFMFKL